jgi:hypothetical protein
LTSPSGDEDSRLGTMVAAATLAILQGTAIPADMEN